jgi:hypothetical protein
MASDREPLEAGSTTSIEMMIPSTKPHCCWQLLSCWTVFSVPVLCVVVIFMFIQLQYLTATVRQEQGQIKELLEQVQNQQQGQQTLTQRVENEHSLTLYQMAGTFTLLVSLLTMFHMSTHLRNYKEPIVQRKVIAILWMSPIYCLTSFLSLVFPSADGYLAVIKDFYEAYVIYNFLSFLIAVLGRGDRETAVQRLAARHLDHPLDPPTRFLRRFYHPAPETSVEANANAVLTECQILCLQFVLVRPLTSIAGFVASSLAIVNDTNDSDTTSNWAYFRSPNFYIAMVTNASVFFAFTGLLKFYHAVRDDLSWLQPFSKFMSIKGIVFLTFWQGLAISILVNLKFDSDNEFASGATTIVSALTNSTAADSTGASSISGPIYHQKTAQEQAAEIQNILICVEMLFFSIAHWCVFPAEEWDEGYRPKSYAKPGIGLQDFVSDMSYIVSSSRRRRRHGHELALQESSTLSDLGEGDDAENPATIETTSSTVNPKAQ